MLDLLCSRISLVEFLEYWPYEGLYQWMVEKKYQCFRIGQALAPKTYWQWPLLMVVDGAKAVQLGA